MITVLVAGLDSDVLYLGVRDEGWVEWLSYTHRTYKTEPIYLFYDVFDKVTFGDRLRVTNTDGLEQNAATEAYQ